MGTQWFSLVFGVLSLGYNLIWVLGFKKGGIFGLGVVGPALSCLEEERGREWDEDKDENEDEDEDGERRDFGEKRKGEV